MFNNTRRDVLALLIVLCLLGALAMWITSGIKSQDDTPNVEKIYGVETCTNGVCEIKDEMFLSKIEAIVFIQLYVDSLNANVAIGGYQIVQGEPHTFVSLDNRIRLKEYKLYK